MKQYPSAWRPQTSSGGGGSSDHGGLSGLSDDDHSQYHNDTRGDARYYTQSAVDALLAGLGGGSSPAILKANGTATASLDDTEAALTWASPSINQMSADVTVSGSQITIVTAGVYKFTTSLRTDNGNRTELFIRTYIDPDGLSGLTQDADELVSDYVSRDGDQDTGSVVLSTALDLAAGAVVEFRGFGDTDGTCVILTSGTRLLIEKF